MSNSCRWAIVWQDSLLCTCFDRSPVTAVRSIDPLVVLTSKGQRLTYSEGMYALSHLLMVTFATRHSIVPSVPTHEEILSEVSKVNHIGSQLCENIRTREQCDSLEHLTQHHCFKLHSFFTIGTLLRPSLSPKRWVNMAPDQKQDLAARCIQSYTSSLEAFIQLHTVSIAATRSWSILHSGLASALVLAITGQTKRNLQVAQLQSRLIETLAQYTTAMIWGPHKRGISALKKIDACNLVKTIEASQQQSASEIVDSASPDSLQPPDPRHIQKESYSSSTGLVTENPAICVGNDGFSFDPEILNDLSTFLPEGASRDDLNIENIFDSVLWGSYGPESHLI